MSAACTDRKNTFQTKGLAGKDEVIGGVVSSPVQGNHPQCGTRDQLGILVEDFFTDGLDVGRRHRISAEAANMYSTANFEEPLRSRRARVGPAVCVRNCEY